MTLPPAADALPNGPITEDQLLGLVLGLASQLRLRAYHGYDNRRLNPDGRGFPDLVIAGPRGMLFRELKDPGGELSSRQTIWRYALLAAGQDVGVWRPGNWRNGAIEAEMRAIARVNQPPPEN